MERFTRKIADNIYDIDTNTYEKHTVLISTDCLSKLGEYEDLEEDGRLIRLPCKVGDKVWINYHDFIYESSVSGFFIEKNQIIVEFGCSRPFTATYATNLGKTIFLSYEEAEKHLTNQSKKYII